MNSNRKFKKNGSTSDGSNIDWEKWVDGDRNGFAYDSNGKPISKPDSPIKGQQYDRYGTGDGRFTSPIEDGNTYTYEQRALPYKENPYAYNKYEVTRNFSELPDAINSLPNGQLKTEIMTNVNRFYEGNVNNLTANTGTIAPGFNQPGGGVQTQFPLSVDTLVELGFLKNITPVPLTPTLTPGINIGAIEGSK